MSAPENPLDKGLTTAHAVLDLLSHDLAPLEQKRGWTLEQAAASIDHLKLTGADWRVVAAYLACQVHAARRISGAEDHAAARLALIRIRTAVNEYERRHS